MGNVDYEELESFKAKLRADAEEREHQRYKKQLEKRNLKKLASSASSKPLKSKGKKKKVKVNNHLHSNIDMIYPERALAKQEKLPKKKRKDWIQSKCIICRAEFAYLPEWKRPPVLCSGCRQERKSVYRRSKRKSSFSPSLNKYSYVKILQGGAPGLGKRK